MQTFHYNYIGNEFFDLHYDKDHREKVGFVRNDFIMSLFEFLEDEFKVPPKASKSIAYALWARMTDMQLHYHTPIHVLSMFQFHKKILDEGAGDTYDLTPSEQLAIWFHDSVYVPGAGEGENEHNSVLFMNAMMQPFIKDKDILARAGELIGETAYHMTNMEEAQGDDIAWAVILDLDLCTFSFEYEDFSQISDLVGKEYDGIYTEEEYKAGRKKFLESMLAKGFIYRTPFFRQRFEEKAKENLTKAINLLSATNTHPHQS
jgi:predicted metal-dependent HD superfamily phosphohydrolase